MWIMFSKMSWSNFLKGRVTSILTTVFVNTSIVMKLIESITKLRFFAFSRFPRRLKSCAKLMVRENIPQWFLSKIHIKKPNQFWLTLFLTLTFLIITDISDSINSRMVPFSVESTFAPRRISSVINSGDCFGLQETPESCPFDDLKHHKYKFNWMKNALTLIRLFSCLICAFSLVGNQFDKHTYNA